MATIRPFSGISYAKDQFSDISNVIAPPYDVLDERARAQLLTKNPHNIVAIDLPHMPPKSVGPDEVYERANRVMQEWLGSGVLKRDTRPALYPYAQNYEHGGRTFHRRGFIALVKLSPFGAGDVVPHEKTYKGPIEDRLKLMRATGAQLSPIFGLFNDPRNEINSLLYKQVGRPARSGTLDGIKNDLWSVTDAEIENRVIDLMKARPIYIADGHHRYTTALQYQFEAEQANGGKPLPTEHPANWCMFVLVGLQDPGLLILPTHRLIGGLGQFDLARLKSAMGGKAELIETTLGERDLPEFINHQLPKLPANTFGLFDGATRRLYEIHLREDDVLKKLEPNQSEAWRRLDVAILQRYLIEDVLQPVFSAGNELSRGYTADPDAVGPEVDGRNYQIGLLLKPTPLRALEDLGKSGEVMPQKSTYFYPKLATGMVINPLR
jgi:uncharacterized protein (DUF1015 family)